MLPSFRAAQVRFGNITLGTYSSNSGGIGDAALQMLHSLININTSVQSNLITTSSDSHQNLPNYVKNIIDKLKSLLETCAEILKAAIDLNSKLQPVNSNNEISEACSLHPFIEETLRLSPVGTILPIVANSLALLAEKTGQKLYHQGFNLLTSKIKDCLVNMQAIIDLLQASDRYTTPINKIKPSLEVTYESKHPYLSNTDEYFPVSFPGAKRITITFSDKSRTESGYDFVRFYKDSTHTSTWHPDGPDGKYSGNLTYSKY